MRHKLKNKRLGKKSTARMSMLLDQTTALIKHGRIKLTLPRAKQVRIIAEKMISKAKYNTLATRRVLAKKLRNNRAMVKKVIEISTRYEGRPGGFTRITRYGRRQGDGAAMAQLELV